METLKKLRDEMHLFSDTQSRRWASTLDAYIKAQEAVEPVAWAYELLDHEGKPNGVVLGILGADRKQVVEQARDCREATSPVFPLYAAPPPREPIAWWDGDKSDPSLSFNGPTKFETIPLFAATTHSKPITRDALDDAVDAFDDVYEASVEIGETWKDNRRLAVEAAIRTLGIEVKP